MSRQRRIFRTQIVLVVVTLLTATGATAQDYTTYYTVMHPEKFDIDWAAHYRNFERMTLETRERLPHELDIAYGNDAKQRLDVYYPTTRPEQARVLVFLHGGGNREGDRLQYGYVAAPFAKEGVITVVASYRLQPEHPWPAQRDDAQAVMDWVYHHIPSRGGDRDRIYLAGHSAGSRLTAVLSYRQAWLGQRSLPADLIKGAALISGLSSIPDAKDIPDDTLRAESNVLAHVENPPPRNVIAVGALEADGGRDGNRLEISQQLADLVREQGTRVEVLVPEGHDHATLVRSLGEPDSELFQAILGMMRD